MFEALDANEAHLVGDAQHDAEPEDDVNDFRCDRMDPRDRGDKADVGTYVLEGLSLHELWA